MFFFANVQMRNQGQVRSGGERESISYEYVALSCFFLKKVKDGIAVVWDFNPDFIFYPFLSCSFLYSLSLVPFSTQKASKAAPSLFNIK